MLLQEKCCPIVASMYLGMYAVESLKDLIFGFSRILVFYTSDSAELVETSLAFSSPVPDSSAPPPPPPPPPRSPPLFLRSCNGNGNSFVYYQRLYNPASFPLPVLFFFSYHHRIRKEKRTGCCQIHGHFDVNIIFYCQSIEKKIYIVEVESKKNQL